MTVIYPLGRGGDMSESEYQAMYEACGVVSVRVPPSLSAAVGLWQTSDRRTLKIAEMTRAHLTNAIALFSMAGLGDHEKIWELRDELRRRGP